MLKTQNLYPKKFQVIETEVAKTFIKLTQAPEESPNKGEIKLVPNTTIPVFIPSPIPEIIKNFGNFFPQALSLLWKVQDLFKK